MQSKFSIVDSVWWWGGEGWIFKMGLKFLRKFWDLITRGTWSKGMKDERNRESTRRRAEVKSGINGEGEGWTQNSVKGDGEGEDGSGRLAGGAGPRMRPSERDNRATPRVSDVGATRKKRVRNAQERTLRWRLREGPFLPPPPPPTLPVWQKLNFQAATNATTIVKNKKKIRYRSKAIKFE